MAHLYFNEDYPEVLTEFKRLANADKTFYKLSAISDDIVANDYPVSRELYDKYSQNLRRAVDAVFNGDDADSDLALRLKAGVTRFGAFKAFNATQDIRSKGRTGAATAADDAENVEKRYNSFQAAEYATAASRARTAKQFAEYLSADRVRLFPNLRWLPSRSVEVRPEHRVFWNRVWPKTSEFWQHNQPGNLWNCKCDMEETDDPTDIPEKLNPKYSSASPGLKGNPAVTGKIFSDDCSYIQRVTNPDTVREIEVKVNKIEGHALKKDVPYKDLIKSQRCPLVIEGKQTEVCIKVKLEVKECIDGLMFGRIEDYYLKNELLKRWPDLFRNTTYDGKEECDTTHNSGDTKKYKEDIDYFYYYKTPLPNGTIIYISVAHNVKDDSYRLYAISEKRSQYP